MQTWSWEHQEHFYAIPLIVYRLIVPILLSSWKALEKTGNEIKQDLEHE